MAEQTETIYPQIIDGPPENREPLEGALEAKKARAHNLLSQAREVIQKDSISPESKREKWMQRIEKWTLRLEEMQEENMQDDWMEKMENWIQIMDLFTLPTLKQKTNVPALAREVFLKMGAERANDAKQEKITELHNAVTFYNTAEENFLNKLHEMKQDKDLLEKKTGLKKFLDFVHNNLYYHYQDFLHQGLQNLEMKSVEDIGVLQANIEKQTGKLIGGLPKLQQYESGELLIPERFQKEETDATPKA